MNILKCIEENSILIIPASLRNKVLKYFNDEEIFNNVKIITFNDLKKGLLFDYTNETINYVMSNYNTSYQVSKEYINSLYYLDDSIENEKFVFLTKLKNDLDDNSLLIYDNLYDNFLESKNKLYVFGFNFIESFNRYLLDIASKYISIDYLETNEENFEHTVYGFRSMDEEVQFVAENIAKLLSKGIDPNDIFIANYNNEYRFSFKYIFKNYGIPIYLPSEDSLYSTSIAKYFLDNLSTNLDILFNKLRKEYDCENNKQNDSIVNKLFNLVNKYYWCDDLSKVENLLINEMKQIKINPLHMEHEVTISNIINNCFNDQEYVFLIGFNDSSIPKLKRDEDYISDDIKPEFLDKTNIYNKRIKESTIKAIKNIKNLTITYKLSSKFNNYLPSYLINSMNLNVVLNSDDISYYSDKMNILNLAKKYDSLIKYNVVEKNIELLSNTYDINYRKYNNQFNITNNKKLLKLLDNNLTLSYSNINTYYKCPFKFYMSDILHIKEYQSLFEAFVGSLFHHCLELCLSNDSNIDQIYDSYIEENYKNPTNKEKYFLSILKDEIKAIIPLIREQHTHSKANKESNETMIVYDCDGLIKYRLKGIVDKIFFYEDEAIIIDYKTNNSTIDLNKMEFGMDIQLPIYLYLLNIKKPNIKIVGLYLQHILTNNKKMDARLSVEELRKKNLRLCGLTLDDSIKDFDDTYESSTIIESLKVKDGKITGKNVLSEEDSRKLTNLIEDLINNCLNNVVNGNFIVNPLILDKKSSCDYCEYKDVCYRTRANYNYQTTKKSGDDDE
ncbi:MAG: PD-(D/E)XK nuclease family protein [Bacilli bacterium]|nr:PD-(D/E)XK nuclease family protein [Bacilli bacterium]